jgi:hypothetical protein
LEAALVSELHGLDVPGYHDDRKVQALGMKG